MNCSRSIILLPIPNINIASKRLKSPSATSYSVNSSNSQRIDTEQLRIQLNQLHAEAEAARSKANNARLRLMRLSEAAGNLQKRAANSVLVGKETEARELLIQKKRLMQALDKSKNRVDVLDRLAAKINEAISLKEAQLIGNVGMYPEFLQEQSGRQIRFVNPKEYNDEDSKGTNDIEKNCMPIGEHDGQETQKCEENLPLDCEELSFKEASSMDTHGLKNLASNLNGISSYKDFLQLVDIKLQEVETDLVVFIRVSNLILETEQKQTSSKMQQISGLLEHIRSVRERVASIIKAQTNGKGI